MHLGHFSELFADVKSIFGSFEVSLHNHAGYQISNFDGFKDLLKDNLIFAHLVDNFGRKSSYLNIWRKTEKFNKSDEEPVSDHLRRSSLKKHKITDRLQVHHADLSSASFYHSLNKSVEIFICHYLS
jgi:hypothetical protein